MSFQTVEQYEALVAEQAQQIERLREHIKSLNALVEKHVRKEMLQAAALTAENERLRALLGRWKTAREAVHEALQTAQELNHGFRAALQSKEGDQ